MRKQVVFCFLCLFWVSSSLVHGQVKQRVGLEGHSGWILAHASDLIPVSQSQPWGASLNYSWLNTDRKKWEVCNCFHYLGAILTYHNFNNPDVLGSALSLSLLFEPILWKHKNWEFSLRSGIGASYLNRVYDEIENPDNTFFSAPISFLLFVNPVLSYELDPQWRVNIGFHYNHISNGGQKQPNRGINYPMVGFGVAHILNPVTLPNYERAEIPQQWQWYLETAYTTRENQQDPQQGRNAVVSLVGGAYKSLTAINALGAGLEVSWDRSLQVESKSTEALLTAPYVAHHFLFGRVDFSQRMGIYLNKPSGYVENLFYQRYLLTYSIGANLTFGASMKVHGHVAENIDVRLGWKF
ncbi:acyloxyacyl hydrolase [Pararhodonellum marinum]|uniref:acyloxyacyl hydrolase n=1 Tax=Pararhodonellum marinum TaxID=2755358 RepID=UPI00188F5DEA|nr:acyloxyacyl hydrolase [Pararhodonellum marinum]